MSWQPQPDNPLLGNFCIRLLEAVAPYTEAVLLSVKADGEKGFRLSETLCGCYRKVEVRYTSRNGFMEKCSKFIAYQKAMRYVRRRIFKPDLLHLHVAFPAGCMALFWKCRYGLHYVLSEHSSEYFFQRRGGRTLPFLWRKIAQQADAIFPVSRCLAEAMEASGIHRPYHIVPNVVDEAFLSRNPQTREEGKLRLLHVSSLDAETKNFGGLLRVIERLSQECPSVELRVVHDFPNPRYETWVRQHGLQEVVRFLGPKSAEDLADEYAHADALLMFSDMETFSCTVMEALAVGIPVFATRVGAVPELLTEGCGAIVEPKDEEALFQLLLAFAARPFRPEMSSVKSHIRRLCSPESVGRMMAETMSTLYTFKK